MQIRILSLTFLQIWTLQCSKMTLLCFHLFTLMLIRIQLPKIIWIRIRGTASESRAGSGAPETRTFRSCRLCIEDTKVTNKWEGSFLQPGNLAFVWPSNQTRSTRLLVSPGQVTTLIQPQVTTYCPVNQGSGFVTSQRILIYLFTLMQIRILFLIKVIRICDHLSTKPPESSFSASTPPFWASTAFPATFWASKAPEFGFSFSLQRESGFETLLATNFTGFLTLQINILTFTFELMVFRKILNCRWGRYFLLALMKLLLL
jgi:hypothetical protein